MPATLPLQPFPLPNGLGLLPLPDPSGNSAPSVLIVYTDAATGQVYGSGAYLQLHGSAGIRLYLAHAPGDSGADQGGPFELDANDKLTVANL